MELFRDYLENEKRYSSHTVETYSVTLIQFMTFLEETKQRNCLDADSQDIANFLAHLKSARHLKRISQLNRLSGLNTFYRFLRKRGIIDRNPCEGTGGRIKAEKKLPVFLSLREAELFLSFLEERYTKDQTFLHARDRALFEFLYSTGLRVGEVVHIQVGDLNYVQKTVKVLGKGEKERVVPFNQSAFQVLQDYFAFRRPKPEVKEIFLNYRQEPLTTRGVRTILRSILLEIDLKKPISPHTFRHSFASHFLSGGADLRMVQEALGHSSLSTTQIYTHLDWEKMKNIYDLAHPRSRKKED